ncbi:unnamed protein product, partial [Allacma fusca]
RAEFTKEIQDNPRDFIDAYLGEIKKTTDPNSSFYGTKGDTFLSAVALDLFQAGSLTTSTSLAWAVLFSILHLDVQEKFQKEIDEVVGSSRRPSLADRPKMIYTEAFICEIRAHPSKPKPTMEAVPVFDVLEAKEFFIILKDRRE